MKNTLTSAAPPISQEALNSLLIIAARNPRGEAQDENGFPNRCWIIGSRS